MTSGVLWFVVLIALMWLVRDRWRAARSARAAKAETVVVEADRAEPVADEDYPDFPTVPIRRYGTLSASPANQTVRHLHWETGLRLPPYLNQPSDGVVPPGQRVSAEPAAQHRAPDQGGDDGDGTAFREADGEGEQQGERGHQ